MHKLTLVTMISLFSFLFGQAHAADASGETKEELALRIKKDREVLKALANAHSDLSKPHEIEFHFVGYEEAKVSAVAEDGKRWATAFQKSTVWLTSRAGSIGILI